MNLLAHLYLSRGINKLMIGNFIGDFVKGNGYLKYSSEVQNGILLHREIDSYSDNHEAHRSTRDKFREGYRLHSGIVVDIIYDHFLAKNWNQYYTSSLEAYSQDVYTYIQKNLEIIPDSMKPVLPYIIKNNWILMYRDLSGIERALYGMSKRTSLPAKASFAMRVLDQHYAEIELEMAQIITDLHKMVEKSLYLTKFATK